MTEVLNKTIGKYLLKEELGGGSTAYVYKGIDTTTHRPCRRKDTPRIPEKKLNYRRTVPARIEGYRPGFDIPNIIEFIDYYEDEEHFLYVMEYLSTYTLEDILEKKKRLPVRLAIPIMQELCDALSYAHALKIVHRDLKPSKPFCLTRQRTSSFRLWTGKTAYRCTDYRCRVENDGKPPHFMAPEQVHRGRHHCENRYLSGRAHHLPDNYRRYPLRHRESL